MLTTLLTLTFICGILGLFKKLEKHIIILGTSLFGSYIFIKFLSLFIGGWPNEYQIYKFKEIDAKEVIPITILYYVVGTILCFIIGATV